MRPDRNHFRGLILLLLLVVALPIGARNTIADHVVVNKSERRLYLMQGEDVLREYKIALGLAPAGHKKQEGDFRTPEGKYLLTRRLVDSDFFMAIEISYPNPGDLVRAQGLGVDPGGYIMIHGQPLNPKKPARYYENYDWTDGCIAVSNSAMADIWQFTRINTPITILP